MNYRNYLHPQLRLAAVRMPYHAWLCRAGNLFQTAAFHMTPVLPDISCRTISLTGYKGMPFDLHLFEPADAAPSEEMPCLFYIHGGAFSYKAAAYHKKLACLYAKGARCRVYFPDYHLAPEFPFPAGLEDIFHAYRYMLQDAGKRHSSRILTGIAGDSAGACLAAQASCLWEKRGLKTPDVQMLIYPVTDCRMQTPSMQAYTDTPLWNASSNRKMWQYYCPDLKGQQRYIASPMQAPLPAVIPVTYIETAQYDCLHDEGILYGEKLEAAGGRVLVHETTGTMHGYDILLHTQPARQSIARRIHFLRKAFEDRRESIGASCRPEG